MRRGTGHPCPTGTLTSVTRQNVYDNESFFRPYQAMRDSRTGINEAIEQPALRAMLPPVAGRMVVDLGCGDGQLSRELATLGASSVLGVDPSERMLTLARKRTADDRVRYLLAFAEDVTLAPTSVDIVVSSLALHYVADFDVVMTRIAGWLRPGGWLVASMEHPMRTAAPDQKVSGSYVIDRYAQEGPRATSWYVDGVIKYHRRLSTILNAVIGAGLVLQQITEPTPTTESLEGCPRLEVHRRSPALLLLSATKS